MTAVRFRDAVAYGARIYGYLFLVTIVGGAMLALGGGLLWTEFQAGAGGLDTTTAASGGLLALLGTSILVTCYAGVAYKLLADAVATGRDGPRGHATSAPTAGENTPVEHDGADATPDPQRAPSVDPDASAVAADADGAPEGASATKGHSTTSPADAADAETAEDADVREPAGPPEPTPEEIAFGSSGNEAETDRTASDSPETVTETDDATGGSTTPAGRSAPSDPLADPMDDE